MKKKTKIILGSVLGVILLGGIGVTIGVNSKKNLDGAIMVNLNDLAWREYTVDIAPNTMDGNIYYASNDYYICNVEYKVDKDDGTIEVGYGLHFPAWYDLETQFTFGYYVDGVYKEYVTPIETSHNNWFGDYVEFTDSEVLNRGLHITKIKVRLI